MKNTHWKVFLIPFLAYSFALASEPIQLFTYGTHSRLVIQMEESAPARFNSTRNGFEAYFEGKSLNDLGAPLGREENWKTPFLALKDSRVDSLEIEEVSKGLKIRGKWRFPTGKMTLANPEMEAFDYFQKSPSQYVIDFWVKAGPTLAQAEEENHRRKSKEIFLNFKKIQESKAKRGLASVIRPVQDRFVRSCGEPISNQNDLFLEFYPVHKKVEFSRWFSSVTPDLNFKYSVPQEKSKEAQYVRLALNLNSQGKTALTIRALDFLDEEFPQSRYRKEMTFLRANSLIRLGLIEEGEKLLKEISTLGGNSEIALLSSVYLSSRLMEKGNGLAALENFLNLSQHFPNTKWTWVFHLGAAECYFALKQSERALKEYQWVIENAPDEAGKAEAAFRMGDVFLQRRQYEQGLAAYFHASEYFKNEAKQFPSFYLNKGESYYNLGKFNEAKSTFESFLKDFPSHPQGWRATFRLGEIAARASQITEGADQSRQWYYETINRYPSSPGVTLARIRLAPCGDHGGFVYETQDRFFNEEAKKFDGKGEVYLTHYEAFRSLGHLRTLVSMGTLEQALDGAIREIRTTSHLQLKKILIETAHQIFAKIIVDLTSKGQKHQALSIYTDKGPQIPDSQEIGDIKYLLDLSQAASDLGLGKFSVSLADTYKKLNEKKMKQMLEGRSLASLKEISSDGEDLYRISEESFVEAKGLWISSRSSDHENSIDRVKTLLSKVSDESKYAYPKYVLLSLLEEKKGNLKSAVTDAARAQVMGRSLRLDGWLAHLYTRLGEYSSALHIYSGIKQKILKKESISSPNLDLENLLGLPGELTLNDIVLAEGEILEKQGRWGEVAAVYSQAVSSGWGGTHLLYEYARSLMKSGDRVKKRKAEKALEELITSKPQKESDKYWIKLAEETLADERQKDSLNEDAKEGRR